MHTRGELQGAGQGSAWRQGSPGQLTGPVSSQRSYCRRGWGLGEGPEKGESKMWQSPPDGSVLCMVGGCPGVSGRPPRSTVTTGPGPWLYPSFWSREAELFPAFLTRIRRGPGGGGGGEGGESENTGNTIHIPRGPGYRNVSGQASSKCVLCGSPGEPAQRQLPESGAEGLG